MINVCTNLEQFNKALKTTPDYKVILFDEGKMP